MDYIIALMNYYGRFSSRDTRTTNGTKKATVSLSGKITATNIVSWLSISIFFAVIGIALKKEYALILGILYIVAVIIVILQSIFTYKKLESKPQDIDIYQRELPSKLRPAHVRLLLNDGLIDEISLSATILDLIDKGYLDIEREKTHIVSKEDIFKKNNIKLIKTGKAEDNLFEYEKFLISWIIDKYGNGKEVSMEKIHENLINNVNEEQPNKLFLEWQGLVLVAFPFKKYYKIRTNNNKTWIYTIFILLGIFPIIPGLGQVLAIYGLGCLLMANPKCILNKLGIEEKDSWKDLKKYLLDFSNIQDKSIEMVNVWEFYLTYSLVLNINTKANKKIEEFIGEKIYSEFPEKITNSKEKKILVQRLKLITNDEIEQLINTELEKYNM